MRTVRTVILFFLGSILCSCGQGSNTTSTRSADTAAAAHNKIVETYRSYIHTLDTTDAGTATLAANKYKELFHNNDTDLNDMGYVIFEGYYTQLMSGINNHFESEKTLDKDRLKANGFEFIGIDGDPPIIEDRDFIAKCFYSLVSSTMKKYLEEVNKENKEGLESDGALLVGPNDLGERAIWWEDFSVNYPHFAYINEVLNQKKLYLTILLEGEDNSPILNYDSHNLTEFYKGAYDHLLSKHPNATVTKMVKPYYEALKSKDTAGASQIVRQYEDQNLLLR